MNVTIYQTNPHTTFDGHTATYALVRDALTAKRVALFQVVDLGEGVTQYRTMDRRSLPPDFTFDEAIKLAMSIEPKRRGSPPSPVRRLPVPTPARPNPMFKHLPPMHLPPERGYRRPSDTARPMRRLLCEKLAAHAERKAVAA